MSRAAVGLSPTGTMVSGVNHPPSSTTRCRAIKCIYWSKSRCMRWVCDFVRRAQGRSSRQIQQEFEYIRRRRWARHVWQRCCFLTTSGDISGHVITRYLDRHNQKRGFDPSA
ncbi:MAG: transposase [Pseudomonadota bacterium]